MVSLFAYSLSPLFHDVAQKECRSSIKAKISFGLPPSVSYFLCIMLMVERSDKSGHPDAYEIQIKCRSFCRFYSFQYVALFSDGIISVSEQFNVNKWLQFLNIVVLTNKELLTDY